ncbi:MAG: efflux RND transporter periplasmic adaptor subunit [Gemmatimonadetes bacterium]|nr:efflux RND transporter periplasmic adaptor subunit [Gemmatimonadota bacterium]
MTSTETAADLSRLRIDRSPRPAPGGSRAFRRVLLIGVPLVLAAAAALVLRQGAGAVDVKVARAEVRGGGSGVPSGITANGYVVARTKASVASKISGRLDFLGVTEGSKVEKGEVIARLESADYVAGLSQARADVARARAALIEARADRDQLRRDDDRMRRLLEGGMISQQQAEAVAANLAAAEARVSVEQAQVQASQAAVEIATANFENTVIRAPFDGTVLRKDAEVGEVVAPSVTGGGLTRGAVVTMADLATLEVEVDVNEAYIARIRDDQPARVQLNAYPDTTFAGEVRQIVPTADRQKATVLVKVSILDRDPRILPEMGAKVEFAEDAGEASAGPARIFVPAAAVRDVGGRQLVWLVRDERLERREVEAGPVSGDWREVRSGLTGGEQVVVEGPRELAEGARASVVAS